MNSIIKPLQILQLTDLHLFSDPAGRLMGINTEDSFHRVLERAKQYQHWPPDLILLTGDLAQEPTTVCYRRMQLFLDQLDIQCLCLPGNHDDPNLMQKALHKGNVQVSFQTELRGWQILCLNTRIPESEGGAIADNELDRLEACLAQYPDKPALIALHHHPLPVNSAWVDTMVVDNAVELFTRLVKYPQVRLLICGHIHQQWETNQRGIQILSCPSTCFQFMPESDTFAVDELAPGYRWLRLYPDGHVKTKIIRLDKIPSGLDREMNAY